METENDLTEFKKYNSIKKGDNRMNLEEYKTKEEDDRNMRINNNKMECFSQPPQEDIQKICEEDSFLTPSFPFNPIQISISSHGKFILVTYQCKANKIFEKEGEEERVERRRNRNSTSSFPSTSFITNGNNNPFSSHLLYNL